MARGWESKAIEDQIAQAETRKDARRKRTLTPDETELIADSLEESQRDVNRLVVRVNGLLVKIEAIKLLLREAGESHTDYVFVPDLDAILGTRYGR